MLLLMQECYKLSIPIIAPVHYYEHRLKSKGVGMKYFRATVVNYLIPGTPSAVCSDIPYILQ